ncbi:MAG: hypothetical protein U0R19_10540 [Bryobacteraceae bacterium]
MKNSHLPLSDKKYELLRAEAERSQVHATKTLHVEIAAYAAEMAGTEFDLDPHLEAATIEHLTLPAPNRKK